MKNHLNISLEVIILIMLFFAFTEFDYSLTAPVPPVTYTPDSMQCLYQFDREEITRPIKTTLNSNKNNK